jgi:hypothetical protein
MTISWNKRRTTKYANDHSTRDLQQTGKATLPGRYLDDTDRCDRVFEPHALSEMVLTTIQGISGVRATETHVVSAV